MKTLSYLLLIFCIFTNAQVGVNTDKPDPSAILDLGPGNRALRFPEVALQSTSDLTTIANPAHGLIVYNTNEDTDSSLFADNYYYFNSNLQKWVAIINSEYAESELDKIKPPLYVGELFKTNQQVFTNLDNTALNVIDFAQSNSTTILNQNLIERLPGSTTTFKILRTGIFVFEGFASYKFTLSANTFWTLAIQAGVSDDSNTTVPGSFTIGMRCPYYSYEANAGFFTTCNFAGAVYLTEGEVIRLIAVKKNGTNPTAGQIGDGVNYSAGVKIIYFTAD